MRWTKILILCVSLFSLQSGILAEETQNGVKVGVLNKMRKHVSPCIQYSKDFIERVGNVEPVPFLCLVGAGVVTAVILEGYTPRGYVRSANRLINGYKKSQVDKKNFADFVLNNNDIDNEDTLADNFNKFFGADKFIGGEKKLLLNYTIEKKNGFAVRTYYSPPLSEQLSQQHPLVHAHDTLSRYKNDLEKSQQWLQHGLRHANKDFRVSVSNAKECCQESTNLASKLINILNKLENSRRYRLQRASYNALVKKLDGGDPSFQFGTNRLYGLNSQEDLSCMAQDQFERLISQVGSPLLRMS